MTTDIYYGDLLECTYSGYAGNVFGIEHEKILEKGIYLIKVKENEYIRLEELLSTKKKKEILKDFATKKGQFFVDNLISINDLIKEKNNKKVVL